MTNITYLFGAGASAKSLPTIAGLKASLYNAINWIEQNYILPETEAYGNLSKAPRNKKLCQQQLFDDWKWLADLASEHASIDVYAKILALRGDTGKLKTLKAALASYFAFDQVLKPVDKRYDAFLASIINENSRNLPSNIKILSWNYDNQFEKSYSRFIDTKDIFDIQYALNIISKNGNLSANKTGQFTIYKLNGSSVNYYYHDGQGYLFYAKMDEPMSMKLIDRITYSHTVLRYEMQYQSGIYFAWDKDVYQGSIDTVQKAIEGTKETEILIVVGYSFPFFNREIDRKIIKGMDLLKKVYFQSLEADALVERFQAIRPGMKMENLGPRKDVEQFLLPNEL